jgi:hypothetical protein
VFALSDHELIESKSYLHGEGVEECRDPVGEFVRVLQSMLIDRLRAVTSHDDERVDRRAELSIDGAQTIIRLQTAPHQQRRTRDNGEVWYRTTSQVHGRVPCRQICTVSLTVARVPLESAPESLEPPPHTPPPTPATDHARSRRSYRTRNGQQTRRYRESANLRTDRLRTT